jgi:hypothetical protein
MMPDPTSRLARLQALTQGPPSGAESRLDRLKTLTDPDPGPGLFSTIKSDFGHLAKLFRGTVPADQTTYDPSLANFKPEKPTADDLIGGGRALATTLFPIGVGAETAVGGLVGALSGEPNAAAHAYQEGAFGPIKRATGLDEGIEKLSEKHPLLAAGVDVAGTIAAGGGAEMGVRKAGRAVASHLQRATDIGEDVANAFRSLTPEDMPGNPGAVDAVAGQNPMPPQSMKGRPFAARPEAEPSLFDPTRPNAVPIVPGEPLLQPGRSLSFRDRPPVRTPDELIDEARVQQDAARPIQRAKNEESIALRNRMGALGLDYAGAVPRPVVNTLARAGAGAAVGASVDDEHRGRGALVGGAAALAGPALLRRAGHLVSDERGAVGALERAAEEGPLTGDRLARLRAAVGAADVDPHEVFNIHKLSLDPAGVNHVEDLTRRLVASGEVSTEPVKWEQTRQIAKELGLKPADLATEAGKGRRSGAEMIAMRESINRDVSAMEEATHRLADPALAAEEREHLLRTIDALDNRVSAVTGRLVKSSQEAGRDLNALRIQANQTRDPAYWLSKAQRVFGGPLPIEKRAELLRVLNTGSPVDIARHVQGLRPAGVGEKAASFLKANILTAPATHVANVLGNTTLALVREVESVPAFLLDRLISPLTKVETKANPFTRELAVASARGASEGVRTAARMMGLPQAGAALREGRGLKGAAREIAAEIRTPDVMNAGGKFVEGHTANYDSALLDTYVKGVFRSLNAEDQVFRSMAVQRSLQEQAILLARREGLKGEARAARVAELVKRPPDELAAQAIEAAEYATFQRRTVLGEMGASVKRTAWHAGQAPGFLAEINLPFVKTPSAILTTVKDYSPVGVLATVPDLVRLGRAALKGTADAGLQRKVVDGLTRAGVGTAGLYIGALLAQNGAMTGGYPSDPQERQQWELDGRQANSVLVRGKWYRLAQLGPVGMLLAVGAHLQQIHADPDLPPVGKAERSATAALNVAGDAPFLQGVGDLSAAVSDRTGTQAGRYLRGKAGMVVPSALAGVARATDPYEREQRGIFDGAISRTPGLRRTLTERLDPLGAPLQRGEGPISSMANPLHPSTDRRGDPLIAELTRVGAHVPGLQQDRRSGETAAQYDARQRVEGRDTRTLLLELVRSEEYQSIPDQVRELVASDPAYRGADPVELGRALQRQEIADLIREIRSEETRTRRGVN